jgi:hypothetical protein
MRYVYVGQFGAFWKLTPKQWEDVCRSGATGEGYTLEDYRCLKTRPRWLCRERETERADRYFSSRNDRTYYEPLDWFPEDFETVLNET